MLSSKRKFPCSKGRGPRGRPRGVRLRADDGFTMIETLVAAVVLITGLVGLLGLLDSSVKASSATHQREAATNLARQVLEDARGIPYPQLDPGSTVSQLQALPNLKNEGSGSSWQLERSGTMYTITLTECSIDDGKGAVPGVPVWGVHKNGIGENPFCKDPGEKEWVSGEPGPDTQPEDLKRITVDVTWTAQGRSPDVRQVETLSAAGAAPGLIAGNLKLETPLPDAGTKTEPVITKSTTTTLTFSVSSPSGTTAMRWSLEGVVQTTPPTLKEGTTWTFTWPIPNTGVGAVSDGTYTVAVQAIDKLGVLGPPVSIPVTLIRNIPAAPSGLKGGFNTINVAGTATKVVELEWQANAERNIIGYRIYRPGGILGTESGLACPAKLTTLSTATSCIDFPPSAPEYKAINRTYTAVALYRNVKNEVAEGSAATLPIKEGPPIPPLPPTLLELKHVEGVVVLKWTAPIGGEPVIFYRIYRGSTNYTSRYDTVSAPTVEYVDSDSTEPHTYWVTAVSANLTESLFLGSVTG